jgi:hypothetical protein
MIAIDGFIALMVNAGNVRSLGLLKKQRHIVVARWVVFLKRQDIIGPLRGDGLGDVLLTSPGINRDDRARQVQQLYEPGNRGDFMGCGLPFQWPSHEAIRMGPSAHHRYGGCGGRMIKRLAQRFAVDRHDFTCGDVRKCLGPGDKTSGEFIRIHP